jgi:glucose/mannose-6-phosphate isomerase
MIDDLLLDDIAGMSALDASDMLSEVASSGAQMREAVSVIDRTLLVQVSKGGQPRNIVVAGLGGSGVGGQVLRAVLGQSVSVPIVLEQSHSLPGWVGPMDVFIGVSCSGMTEETLSTTAEAGRRGARVITIGAGGSDLEKLSASIGEPLTLRSMPKDAVHALRFGLMPLHYLWLLTHLVSLTSMKKNLQLLQT